MRDRLPCFCGVDYLHHYCENEGMKFSVASAFLVLNLWVSPALAEDMTFEEPSSPEVTPSRLSSSCWSTEGFSSEVSYQTQISQWKREAIPFPGPFDAMTAYRVYKNEAAFALEHFKNDKKVHCYMGCRITQDANFETAQWAGWEKEKRDLEDCNPNTHFEVLDYTVTVTGAHLGLKSNRRDDCTRACDQDF